MVNHCVIWVKYEVREYWWYLQVRNFGGGLWVVFFFFFFLGGRIAVVAWRSLSEGSCEMIVRLFRWISGLYL
jgi:hypothetical protein